MKTILVVDDDSHVRSLLKDVLQASYRVVEADDGSHAMAFIAREKPDLIITDRAMPQMGGLELLKKLHADKAGIPAIVISAFGDEAMWSEAIGSGAVEYLLKPFSTQDLLKLVQKHIGA